MAVNIRLRRMGAKRVPFYRIVVADSRFPVQGRFIESLGWYDPRAKQVKADKEKIVDWIEKGAELTESVEKILINYSVISVEDLSGKRGG